jgi:hypothetical protein
MQVSGEVERFEAAQQQLLEQHCRLAPKRRAASEKLFIAVREWPVSRKTMRILTGHGPIHETLRERLSDVCADTIYFFVSRHDGQTWEVLWWWERNPVAPPMMVQDEQQGIKPLQMFRSR